METEIANADRLGHNVHVSRIGSFFTIFFVENPVRDYESAQEANLESYSRFFHCLLNEGIYFPPSQYEAAFISLAHTKDDMNKACQTIRAAL